MFELKNAPYRVVSPGRVNLLGEHVDYNDGAVLPAAIDRNVQLGAELQPGRKVTLHALDLNQKITFDLDLLSTRQDTAGNPLPSWALYPAGVAWVLEQHGIRLQGMEAAFTSSVPMGAGLSSSAAVEVGFAVLWQALGNWELDRLTLARLCQEAENRYVGVNCGLMDQFACANGVAGHALHFDTRTLLWRPVPLPVGAAIIIADSKMRRSLATSAYNERRTACEEAVRHLQSKLPNVRALRDVSPIDFARVSSQLPPMVQKRAQHVVEECARVDEAAQCLEKGDSTRFGQLMFAGHASLRDLYEVSIPELDALVEIAANIPGCLGARLSGAGFGGCTVNLVEEAQAESFIAQLTDGYASKCGKRAEVYLCHASNGAWVEP